MFDIENYYTEMYDEDKRLNDFCDNRHKVERLVKTKILDNLAHENHISTVADIGAGTGLYSLHMAENGYTVSACDLVPKHIDIIKEKAQRYGYNIDAIVGDAASLPYPDNKFDMTLLAGPIYHTHTVKDKLKIIAESKRITKQGGIIVIDYLADIHGYIQHILLNSDNLNKIINLEGIDDVFSYDSLEKMSSYLKHLDLIPLDFYGTDGITRFIQGSINKLPDSLFENWVSFVYSQAKNQNIIDLSEHCLAVCRKR